MLHEGSWGCPNSHWHENGIYPKSPLRQRRCLSCLPACPRALASFPREGVAHCSSRYPRSIKFAEEPPTKKPPVGKAETSESHRVEGAYIVNARRQASDLDDTTTGACNSYLPLPTYIGRSVVPYTTYSIYRSMMMILRGGTILVVETLYKRIRSVRQDKNTARESSLP